MARTKGLLPLSGNFEPQVAGPFDARSRVETKADLLLTATWQAKDGNPYTYVGMVVTVYADATEENNGIYRLKAADYTQANNWEKAGAGATVDLDTINTQLSTANEAETATDTTVLYVIGKAKITALKLYNYIKGKLDNVYAAINHNHTLSSLSEKSYNSLNDKPSIPSIAGLMVEAEYTGAGATKTVHSADTLAGETKAQMLTGYATNTALSNAISALIDGASDNTLKKLQDKITAINAIIGGSTADGDSIVNTVAELLVAFAQYPEGVDIINLLASKVNDSVLGAINGVATLGPDGKLSPDQMPAIDDEVVDIWGFLVTIDDFPEANGLSHPSFDGGLAYVEGSGIYSYNLAADTWVGPTQPTVATVYNNNDTQLFYTWNGSAMVEKTSTLNYASTSDAILAQSSSLISTPRTVYESFKNWLETVSVNSLSTNNKKIVGAINELNTKAKIESLLTGLITTHYHSQDSTKADKLVDYIEKTASFTLTDSDSDKWINCNSSSATIYVQVPMGLTNKKQFYIFRSGTSEVYVIAGSGMTALASKLKLNAQYSAAQISIEGSSFKVIGELRT